MLLHSCSISCNNSRKDKVSIQKLYSRYEQKGNIGEEIGECNKLFVFINLFLPNSLKKEEFTKRVSETFRSVIGLLTVTLQKFKFYTESKSPRFFAFNHSEFFESHLHFGCLVIFPDFRSPRLHNAQFVASAKEIVDARDDKAMYYTKTPSGNKTFILDQNVYKQNYVFPILGSYCTEKRNQRVHTSKGRATNIKDFMDGLVSIPSLDAIDVVFPKTPTEQKRRGPKRKVDMTEEELEERERKRPKKEKKPRKSRAKKFDSQYKADTEKYLNQSEYS